VTVSIVDFLGADILVVLAQVSRHVTPTDPNSEITAPVGGLVFQDGVPNDLGLEDSGEVGIAASAFSTNVNSSVTNWNVGPCRIPAD